MLDTIKIKFTEGRISKASYFRPEYEKRSYQDLSESEKRTNNPLPLRKYKLNRNLLDEYCPSVEVTEKLDKEKKKVVREVLVECSVPKLMRENNLIEIDETDYPLFVSMLKNKLSMVGIIFSEEQIANAGITKLHASKNVILPNKYSIDDIISQLRTTEMGKSYDASEKRHVPTKHGKMHVHIRNKDEVFTHYTTTRSYVFYDKIRDMQKPKSKSTDKDKTDYEKELLEIYNLYHKEILRFEYRLTAYTTVHSEINAILHRSYDTEVQVRDIFSKHLWEKLVVGAWDRILDRPENQLALKFGSETPQNVLRAMILATDNKQSAHGMNGLIMSYGLAHLANEYGMKHIKKEFGRVWSQKACGQRLSEKVSYAVELMNGLKYPESIEYVDTHIRAFEQVTEKHLTELI